MQRVPSKIVGINPFPLHRISLETAGTHYKRELEAFPSLIFSDLLEYTCASYSLVNMKAWECLLSWCHYAEYQVSL